METFARTNTPVHRAGSNVLACGIESGCKDLAGVTCGIREPLSPNDFRFNNPHHSAP